MRSTGFGPAAMAAAALSLFAQPPAYALDTAQLLAKVSPSVFTVATVGPQRAPLSTGSAVVIGPGQLVTACHVLAGARGVTVQRDNVSYGATLDAPDVERDICLLKVANFNAPAVALSTGAPAFGQRVFTAVAAEDGRVALNQGAVAGMRAGADGSLDRIQASVAPAANASGGGLFDDSGRLVGVLTRGATGDTLTSALPSAWIASAATRGTQAVASYTPPNSATSATSATSAASTTSATAGVATSVATSIVKTSPAVGEVWRYELLDRLTNVRREVVYRVDRVESDRVVFNQGARVEAPDGQLQRIASPIGGDFDGVSPPTGWVPANPRPGMTWKVSYNAPASGARTELEGRVGGTAPIRLPSGEYQALRITYEGTMLRSFYGAGAVGSPVAVPYKVTVWYAPELRRVVRFDASYTARYDRGNETLTLVEHRFD